MTGPIALAIACLALAAAMVTAVRGTSSRLEGPVAAAAAALVVLTGVVPASVAGATVRQLAGTVGFLAAILVLGHLLAEEGVFVYLGRLAALRSAGSPIRLLAYVVAIAGVVTAVLTLDTTVTLLTPVVVAATMRMRVPATPHTFACVRVANAGSVLLPVSNLTNLLAFGASGLGFARFAALLLAPWLVILAAEWALTRRAFSRELIVAHHGSGAAERAARQPPTIGSPEVPTAGIAVLVVTVCGFVALSGLGLSPAWMAAASCVFLGVRRLRLRQTSLRRIAREARPSFLLFVFSLGVIVDGVSRHGVGRLLDAVVPSGRSLAALLVIALLAGLVANIVNNIPATLVLLPIVAGSPLAVLAVLIGVNVGPNLTYGGSLATLLWRRVVPADLRPSATRFHLAGIMSVAPIIVVATCLMWLSARVIGV